MRELKLSLVTYFDSIRIVNLVHRNDHRQEVRSELARLSIEVDKENVKFYSAVRPEESAGFPSDSVDGRL